MEDFNFQSLKSDIEPLVIAPREDKRVAVIRLNAGSITEALAVVEKAYRKAASAYRNSGLSRKLPHN